MSEYSQTVLGELDRAGIPYRICNGGSHKLVEWTGPNGRRRKCQADITASDHRSVENARHEVRRMLREDGFIEPVEAPRLFFASGRICSSSLDVAHRFQKAHKDVLRAFDQVAVDAGQEFTERNFTLSSYRDGSGRSLRCVEMTRDGFSLLAMGFTGKAAIEWKIKYLAAFSAMEAEIREKADLRGRVERLEKDLQAATELLLEIKPPPARLEAQPARVRKAPFVRPSVVRAVRRSMRGAQPFRLQAAEARP